MGVQFVRRGWSGFEQVKTDQLACCSVDFGLSNFAQSSDVRKNRPRETSL
jgi:hypothetical protein